MALSRAIIAIAILFISVAARAERRVALVIGNSAYASVGALANPVRDAKAVAEALRAAGFAEVAEGYDLSKPQFDAALKRFGDAAAGADWALIYYAGHGIGIGGETYVLPVDAVLERAEHAEDEAISLSRLRAKADGATALRMVILDSCRGNPFAARLAREAGAKRAISRGLPAPPCRRRRADRLRHARERCRGRWRGPAQPVHHRVPAAFAGAGARSPVPVRQGARQRAGRDRPRANAHHLRRSRRRHLLFPGAPSQGGNARATAAALRGRGSWRILRTPAAKRCWRRSSSASARRPSAISPARASPKSGAQKIAAAKPEARRVGVS